MAFKFNGDISVADVVSLGTAGIVGLVMMFDIRADVDANSTKNLEQDKEIHRVELQAKEDTKEVLEAVKELKQDGKEANKQVNDKLDMLIERELNGRR